jgi:hypothetical protein
MTPTNELRFVRRMIKLGEEEFSHRMILQQKWIPSNWAEHEEWRDVPVAEE